MRLTATLASESLLTGGGSSPATSSGSARVYFAEFYAGRPIPLPDTESIDDIVEAYEQDPIRSAAMIAARARLAGELYAHRPSGLAALRMSRGFSQARLAASAKTSQSHVAKVEAGRNDPGTDFIARVADALGVDPADVFRAVLADQRAAEESL